MEELNYTLTTTPNNNTMTYMKVLPPPFDLDTASLSDLVAAMQWLKWEIETWKRILKAETKDGDEEGAEHSREEIEKRCNFLEAIDDEIDNRLKSTLDTFQTKRLRF